jgi:hypothetical protein
MQTKLNTTETEGWIRILQKWQVVPILDRVDVTLSRNSLHSLLEHEVSKKAL